jgi:hypothetical protein
MTVRDVQDHPGITTTDASASPLRACLLDAAFCAGANPASDIIPFDDHNTAAGARRVGRPDRRAAAGSPDTVGIDGPSAPARRPWPTSWPPPYARRRHVPCSESRSTTSNGMSTYVRTIPGSPENYYFEMFDIDAIRDELLAPLGPGGNRRYRTQIMDVSCRTPIDSGVHVSPDDAILVADGGFLQKRSGPVGVCGCEGRHRRSDPDVGAGGRSSRGDGEQRRSRLDRDGVQYAGGIAGRRRDAGRPVWPTG